MAFHDPAIVITELDPAVRAMLAEDLPEQAESIRNALARNDLVTAISTVHSLHGSAAFCRLDALRESSARLEAELKKKEKNAETISAFESDVKRVLHALEQKDSE
jgi:HPt (histidine-containing phosphotransfer) domain-containing protein